MTTTMQDALARAMAGIDTPEHRASWESHAAALGEPFGTWQGALDAIREAAAHRYAQWGASTPSRFRAADLQALTPQQQPDMLLRWIDDPAALTLLIAGPPGTGKTYAAYALLHAAAAAAAVRGVRLPAAWTVPGLLDALRPSSTDAETVWRAVKTAPLLLLDDLANVRVTDWASERLWLLADIRTVDDLRTIVTTNASWSDMEEIWGAPTMDRFRDRSVVVKFAGGSLRKPAW